MGSIPSGDMIPAKSGRVALRKFEETRGPARVKDIWPA
jgi:hypothetical protein